MDTLLIAARALHFGAAISLAGVFGFACFVSEPALRRSGPNLAGGAGLNRRLRHLAWASLAVALISGAGWLSATSARMSGQPLAAVLSNGVLTTVLVKTRFGEDWLLRFGLAGLLALYFTIAGWWRLRWPALGLAAAMLASLAWAGHGAATPGAPGELHLAGDILHLLGAGLWLGTLLPLEILLAEAARGGDGAWLNAARIATGRFTALAIASVAALLIGGIINTWFLAGTVPALIGTEYGRLLLAKIGLFVAMLLVAAVNLLRLSPRLGIAAAKPTIAQLRRNAWIETGLGLGVVGIVAVIGTMPPGLHSEPGWPLPFRLETATLTSIATAAAALATIVCCGCGIAAVVACAGGRYRYLPALAAAVVLCAAAAWLPLRPAIEPAYPTSFYASPEPFAAPSVARGATVYAANCAMCHGEEGRGDGPAAAGLLVRPANLTEAHLFAHSPGDLFWWISNGHGAMPGFAAVLSPDERWDAINFIRARAAATLTRQGGPEITATATYPVPDFAFEANGRQQTLRQALNAGPVLLALFPGPAPLERLQQLAAGRADLAKAGLGILAVALGPEPNAGGEHPEPPLVVGVSPAVRMMLALYRSPSDGPETELLLDRNGIIRARWTASALAAPTTLATDAARAAEVPAVVPSHAGHGG